MGVTSGDGRGICSEIIPICTVTPSSVRVDALRFLFLFLNFLAQSKMPYWHIRQDLKELVLSLIDNNVVPDDFELNISEIFGVHHAIQRWQRNIELYGSVIPPKNSLQGHPLILNGNQTHDLIILLEEALEMYLDEIQDWVAISRELSISKSTLDLMIRDLGISYKLFSKAAAERDEVAREEFSALP